MITYCFVNYAWHKNGAPLGQSLLACKKNNNVASIVEQSRPVRSSMEIQVNW